jgi:hypothetical protein
MHTLYDSESFIVTHLLAMPIPEDAPSETAKASPTSTAADPDDEYMADRPTLVRHGFEIVDKRSGKELFLDGAWAELFQQRLMEWQRNRPTQDEVETTLEQYAELATVPLHVH